VNCPGKILLLALTVALGLAPGPPPRASRPQEPVEDPRAVIRNRADLVVLPVTVKDAKGAPVANLRRDEFRILEDGVEQQIALFSAEPFSLSVLVLVDDDLKTKPAEQVKQSLLSVAGGFSDSDEFALARFDALYTPMLDFAGDSDRLLDGLAQIAQGSAGAQAPSRGRTTKRLDDAIHAAAEALRGRDRDRRKMILVVSDGLNATNNTYSYEDTLKTLLASGVSVYVVGVEGAVLDRGKSVLARYADATGGVAASAERATDLSHLYAQAIEQARYSYTLGYVAANTDRRKEYRDVEVRIRRPGLNVLAPAGYYVLSRP
jgi:VWFA-related protein